MAFLEQKLIDQTIAAWWTGRDDAGGAELAEAAGVADAAVDPVAPAPARPSSARAMDVADLASMLARAWVKGEGYVRVRLATGTDGDPDLRIELELAREKPQVPGEMMVMRARPGSLLDVRDRGATPRQMGQGRGKAQKRLESVMRIDDFDARSLSDVMVDVAAMKTVRSDLMDQADAGSEAAVAQLVALDEKFVDVRTRLDEANAQDKAELLAKQAEAELEEVP